MVFTLSPVAYLQEGKCIFFVDGLMTREPPTSVPTVVSTAVFCPVREEKAAPILSLYLIIPMITAKAMTNKYLGDSVSKVLEPVASGTRVGAALRKEGVLPRLLIEMTAVGEESGSVEETLTVVGRYYDNEVEIASDRAVSLLEPIIIVFLAVFVVFVLLAVYLPMFSMYGNVS